MSERKHDQKVKDVGIDNDLLCIELLNGLRLTGPLRTKPVYRDPVVPAEAHPQVQSARAPAVIAS